MPAKPRRHERGLTIASSGRTIPRTAPTKKRRSSVPGDVDLDASPTLTKQAGDLVALAARIGACAACDRASPDRAVGTGYPQAPIFLVGERPTAADLEAGGAFAAEGEALDKAFDALGIPLSWIYGGTSVRCGSGPATPEQIEACSIHLLIEIEAVEPSVVVAFGPRATDAVRALDGRCGFVVPDELPQGEPMRLRPGLQFIATEPLPEGVTNRDSKRRLWRDLQRVPALLEAEGRR
ncbi:MAG: uracil-DNA glycosylase family protein [Actinomycetota bacterium]